MIDKTARKNEEHGLFISKKYMPSIKGGVKMRCLIRKFDRLK